MSTVVIPKMVALRLTCGSCNYPWIYKGKSQYRASCPRCRSSVNLHPHRGSKAKYGGIIQH